MYGLDYSGADRYSNNRYHSNYSNNNNVQDNDRFCDPQAMVNSSLAYEAQEIPNSAKSTSWLVKRSKKQAILTMIKVQKYKMKSIFDKWKSKVAKPGKSIVDKLTMQEQNMLKLTKISAICHQIDRKCLRTSLNKFKANVTYYGIKQTTFMKISQMRTKRKVIKILKYMSKRSKQQ